MSKYYMHVRLRGYTVPEVKAALAKVVGPAYEQWEQSHLLGIHFSVLEATEAPDYDLWLNMQHPGEEPPSDPLPVIVVVSLYTVTGRRPKELQMALSETIALQLSAELGVPVTIAIEEEDVSLDRRSPRRRP